MGMFRLCAVGRKKQTRIKIPKSMKDRQERYNQDRVKAMREKLKGDWKV
jgi:hypothetical protein